MKALENTLLKRLDSSSSAWIKRFAKRLECGGPLFPSRRFPRRPL